MDNKTLKLNILLGSMLAGGVVAGCADKQDKEENTNEQKQQETISDPYGNVKLFEDSRSEIKFALAFVENYYPYIYWCGEAWTAGHGLTVLYNANGTSKKVTSSTPVPTIAESDVYKGRYLTFEILPDIKKYVKVPMDKNTLIAACVLRYCIGGSNFAKSSFVSELNAGKNRTELAKTLTGWRQQSGVLNRCYFFAALMMGKMQYSDLLYLRAEGCYNLKLCDMVLLENGKPKTDKNGFYEWDFSKIRQNLEKAKQPRTTTLTLSKKVKKSVKCENVKDIVPDYIWQEVSNGYKDAVFYTEVDANSQNDTSYIAYQNGNYDIALKAAKKALKYATTDKQKGAAYYNMGMAYLANGNYGRAKDCFKQSLAVNETRVAQQQFDIAQQKQNDKRQKTTRNLILGTVAIGALYGGRKYMMRRQNHR